MKYTLQRPPPRWGWAAALLLIALLPLAGCGTPSVDSRSPEPARVRPLVPADLSTPFAAPISDRAIQADIRQAMETLYESGDYPAFEDIYPQRERRKCQLALPRQTRFPAPSRSLYEDVLDSVLVVSKWYLCGNCDRWHQGHAGGFVLTRDGAIVTSYHQIEEDKAAFLIATTRSGRVYPVREILAADPAHDVAILQVDTGGDDLSPARLRADAPVGSRATVIHHPSDSFYCLTEGVVSRYYQRRRFGQPMTWMAITADFARGSSGCPVFDQAGRVIGVVSRTHSIFYKKDEEGEGSNQQMVQKVCSPAQAILNLISAETAD